jgi:hypothetical protein
VAMPLQAGMPSDLVLDVGYTLSFVALNPTTGLPVSGVVVSIVSILAESTGDGSPDDLAVGPFMLVPGPDS